MANIRIKNLPAEATPNKNDLVPLDNATTRAATIEALVNVGRPFASQAEAEAGVIATKAMNPLTVKQALAAQGALIFQPFSPVLSATTASFTTADEAKLDGVEEGADVTNAANVAAAGAVMASSTTTAAMAFVIDEDNMASNSATKVPTQKSVRAFVLANAGGGGGEARAHAGRLTLVSGVAVPGNDVAGATTVYFTPCDGNQHSIFDGSVWENRDFDQLTLTLNNPSHAAGTSYDVFLYWDGAAVRIGTGPAWSSATVRGAGAGTTEVAIHGGYLVNAQSITLRNGVTTTVVAAQQAKLVGTIRTTLAGTTEDSVLKRLVSNVHHAVPRIVRVFEATASWTYSSTTWRQANASPNNQIEVVSTVGGRRASIEVLCSFLNNTATVRTGNVSIGLNSTAVTSHSLAMQGSAGTTPAGHTSAKYIGPLAEGRVFLVWLEAGAGADTQTFFGGSGRGLAGEVIA